MGQADFQFQIVMEGFMSMKLRPIWRRLVSRLLSVVPAVITLAIMGDGATNALLVYSQAREKTNVPSSLL